MLPLHFNIDSIFFMVLFLNFNFDSILFVMVTANLINLFVFLNSLFYIIPSKLTYGRNILWELVLKFMANRLFP